MTEIGNKMIINLHGDTKEELLESIKEERKKICKALRQANDDRDERKAVNFIRTLDVLESIAEIEEDKEEHHSINEKRKIICKALVKAYRRKDRKVNDFLQFLAILESIIELEEEDAEEEEAEDAEKEE